jgi:hypothetical protein
MIAQLAHRLFPRETPIQALVSLGAAAAATVALILSIGLAIFAR